MSAEYKDGYWYCECGSTGWLATVTVYVEGDEGYAFSPVTDDIILEKDPVCDTCGKVFVPKEEE